MCEVCGTKPAADVSDPRTAGRVTRRTVVGALVGAPLLLGARPKIAWTNPPARALRLSSSPTPAVARAEPAPVAPGLFIQPREAWARGDMPPLGAITAEDVKFLIVHHTATGNTYGGDQAAEMVRGVYHAQTTEKGWPDTCYNFLIDRFGGVWEGRAGSLAGPVTVDATGGSQGFAQLVCLIGDFTSEMPTNECLTSLQKTLAWLAGRSAIDTSPAARVSFTSRGSNKWPVGAAVTTPTVVGHREMSATACPGDTLYPFVRDTLPAMVHQYALTPATAGIAAALPEVR
jgi:N-acetylmuramoyl-L-alanine amidase